jgi:hypothetical protein
MKDRGGLMHLQVVGVRSRVRDVRDPVIVVVLNVVVVLSAGSLGSSLALSGGAGESSTDALVGGLALLDGDGSLILGGLGSGEAGVALLLVRGGVGLGALVLEAGLVLGGRSETLAALVFLSGDGGGSGGPGHGVLQEMHTGREGCARTEEARGGPEGGDAAKEEARGGQDGGGAA